MQETGRLLGYITDILQPCILCRNERATVADSKYCTICYKELIINIILKK